MTKRLFSLNSSNQVRWLDPFTFNDAAEKFMGRKGAMKDNIFDAITVQVPGDFSRLPGFYLHKSGGPSRANTPGPANGSGWGWWTARYTPAM